MVESAVAAQSDRIDRTGPLGQPGDVAQAQVRRLLDAGLTLLIDRGTSEAVRVADIVAAAGLSNRAFYRYFASKDDLVTAIVDDGMRRAESYLRHLMDRETSPQRRLRAMISGFLRQATDPVIGAATRAVLAQSERSRDVAGSAARASLDMIAGLAAGPLAELGVEHPRDKARLVAITLSGAVQDVLWGHHERSSRAEEVAAYCLAGVRVPVDAR